jgi:hypothetical protein
LRIHRCVGQAVAVSYPPDEFAGTEPDETPAVNRRRAVVILLSVVLVALLVGLVAVVELRGSGGGSKRPAAQNPPAAAPGAPVGNGTSPTVAPGPPSTVPTTGPAPTGTHKATPPPATGCTTCEMPGDGTVPVGGEDPRAVHAGTYHSDGPTRADGCLWWLATDPQGNNQKAGRTVDHATDVIVKDGMWFHSEGCQIWRLVGPV